MHAHSAPLGACSCTTVTPGVPPAVLWRLVGRAPAGSGAPPPLPPPMSALAGSAAGGGARAGATAGGGGTARNMHWRPPMQTCGERQLWGEGCARRGVSKAF